MMHVFATLDRLLASLLRAFVIAALAITLVLITLGVIARIVPVFSMSGYDEVIEWLVAWMTFAGTVALWRQGILFRIDLRTFMSSAAAAKAIGILAQLLGLLFALVFTIKGYEFAAGSIETMPFLFISKTPWYASMPVCGAFMTIYAVVGLFRAIGGNPEPHVEIP